MDKMASYTLSQIQHAAGLCQIVMTNGVVSLSEAITILNTVANDRLSPSTVTSANKRHPDNIVPCSICGSPTVILPLSPSDCTLLATHAIQCQNRPASDKPWQDGMCGHTEYIVRGWK